MQSIDSILIRKSKKLLGMASKSTRERATRLGRRKVLKSDDWTLEQEWQLQYLVSGDNVQGTATRFQKPPYVKIERNLEHSTTSHTGVACRQKSNIAWA